MTEIDRRLCINCGAPLDQDAKFCSSCGAAVVPAELPAADPVPDPATLPAEQSQPEQADAKEPDVERGPSPAPPGPPPPPQGPSGKTAAIIGGVIVALVISAVFLLGAGSSPSPTPTTEGGGGSVTTTAEETEPEDETDRETDGEGTLRDLVQDRVGEFDLVEVQPDPSRTADGVIDALVMKYRRGDDTVDHFIALWPSVELAVEDLGLAVEFLTAEGLELKEASDLTTTEGETVGRVLIFLSDGGVEFVVWQTWDLSSVVISTEGTATEFFNELPY